MAAIPGLSHIPVEETSSFSGSVRLTSFDLKSVIVPGSHVNGNCRPVSDFDRIRIVGGGTYGNLYKVKDKKSDKVVALKRLKISKDTGLMPQNFLREVNNLKLLKHENIVNLLEVAVAKSFESTYLILENCDYALSNVIEDVHSALLQQPQIKNIMQQLFTGVDYIHRHFVVHRDLRPANVLFTDSGILKISDFGSSRKISPGNPATPNVGLKWYKAPEILFGSLKYSSSIDIWACGCMLAEMMRQKTLFRGETDADMIKLIIDFLGTPTESLWPGYSRLPVPQNYQLRFQPYNRIRSSFESQSTATISLLQKTLLYNPLSRPTAEQCLQHPYFSDYPLACSTERLLQTLKSSSVI